MEQLLASVAQHQRQKNGEQARNRMRARMLGGYWVFMAPLGYRYEKSPAGGSILVRDEPVASIIQEGLEGYASGRFNSKAEVKRFFESHAGFRSEEHTSELQSLMRISYAVFCLKKKKEKKHVKKTITVDENHEKTYHCKNS